MDAKKISISVGKRQLEAARKIARRESLSLSGVFMRGLEKEIEAEERRRALEELVRDCPAVSSERKREIRASWGEKRRQPDQRCASSSTPELSGLSNAAKGPRWGFFVSPRKMATS